MGQQLNLDPVLAVVVAVRGVAFVREFVARTRYICDGCVNACACMSRNLRLRMPADYSARSGGASRLLPGLALLFL